MKSKQGLKQRKMIAELKADLGSAPNVGPVRSRIKSIWECQHYFDDQRLLYTKLESFKPIVKSIDSFQEFLTGCELMLLRTAWGLMPQEEFEEFVHGSILPELVDCAGEWSPNTHNIGRSAAAADVAEFMERAWDQLAAVAIGLQDAMQSATDHYANLTQPRWHRAWDSAWKQLSKPPLSPYEAPVIFQGDLWVEDDCFTCKVDRLTVNGDLASIQMSCIDDGGPHFAEGAFEREAGTWRTRSFSVRYKGDAKDVPATFSLRTITLSPDRESLDLQGEWRQAGETYSLEGTLDKFEATSAVRTIRLV